MWVGLSFHIQSPEGVYKNRSVQDVIIICPKQLGMKGLHFKKNELTLWYHCHLGDLNIIITTALNQNPRIISLPLKVKFHLRLNLISIYTQLLNFSVIIKKGKLCKNWCNNELFLNCTLKDMGLFDFFAL